MRRLLLVERSPGSLDAFAAILAGSWELELEHVGLEGLGDRPGGGAHTVALVEVADSLEEIMQGLAAVNPRHQDLMVVLVGLADDPELLRRFMRLGVFEALPADVEPEQLRDVVEEAWVQLRSAFHRPRRVRGHQQARGPMGFEQLQTCNARYRQLLHRARAAAAMGHPLLIMGEAGTGKTALAEAIHQGGRPRASVLRVPAGELERNRQVRAGAWDLLDRAPGGTLVVSELEQLETAVQARLLRALRQRLRQLVQPPRLIAIMRRSLAEQLRKGAFRGELYHRLGFELLYLPPLRERPEDIELLSLSLLCELQRPFGGRVGSICDEAMARLRSYEYPCNISELETIIDLAAQAEAGPELSLAALPSHVRAGGSRPEMDPGGSWLTLEELQLEHVQRVLVHTHGNRSEAARILGVSRTGLLGKIKRFGIDVPPEQGGQG